MAKVHETRAEAAKRSRPKLKSRDEAAAELNVHVRTVDRLILAGRLKAVKLGRCKMITVTSLDALTTGADAP
jgi:excisionase family DNA binding protein